MRVLFHPSRRGQLSLLEIRQRRQNENCLLFSLREGYTCTRKGITFNLKRLPLLLWRSLSHQACSESSHLVLAQDCKVKGYSINLVSQEAGSCIYFTVIPLFRGLGSFIVFHVSLGPRSYSMTVTSFLFLPKFSLLTELWGCSQYLRLNPPYSGRNICLLYRLLYIQ